MRPFLISINIPLLLSKRINKSKEAKFEKDQKKEKKKKKYNVLESKKIKETSCLTS